MKQGLEKKIEIDLDNNNMVYVVTDGQLHARKAHDYGEIIVRSLGGKIDRISNTEETKLGK